MLLAKACPAIARPRAASLSTHSLPSTIALPTAQTAASARRRCAVSCRAEAATAPNTSSSQAAPATAAAAAKYGWELPTAQPAQGSKDRKGRLVKELPVDAIIRPLGKTRGNDQDKVQALMASIQEVGLQEPIDVLEVDGKFYGFSGCHRYEAHQKLGLPTILCRVRKANQEVLKMHMM